MSRHLALLSIFLALPAVAGEIPPDGQLRAFNTNNKHGILCWDRVNSVDEYVDYCACGIVDALTWVARPACPVTAPYRIKARFCSGAFDPPCSSYSDHAYESGTMPQPAQAPWIAPEHSEFIP